MKKPTIRNWTKYWVSSLAVSGLLVMGACGSEEQTAQDEFETTEEIAVPEREEVSVVEEEEVVEEAPAQEENKTNSARSGRMAYTIRDMDAHLEKFEDVNNAIRAELTDADNMVE